MYSDPEQWIEFVAHQVHSNMYMNIILLCGYCEVVHALTKGRQQNKCTLQVVKTCSH